VISTVGEFTKWRSVDGSFSTTPLTHTWLHCTEEGGRQLSSGELARPKPKPLASGVDKQKAATGRTQAADRRALRSCGTLLCRLTKRCPACVPHHLRRVAIISPLLQRLLPGTYSARHPTKSCYAVADERAWLDPMIIPTPREQQPANSCLSYRPTSTTSGLRLKGRLSAFHTSTCDWVG
jgi:hypothetical protein